jgi:predicted DCC family thiol-disulfide oxidoreductase YuxK
MPQNIIFFDGVCNLCNASVQRVIRNDRRRRFRFAPLQGVTAQEMFEDKDIDLQNANTLILLQEGKLYTRSTAALLVAKQMDGLWPLLYYSTIWIPPFIRDEVYNLIARNRHKWFGKQESCWLPSGELRELFLP